MIDLRGLGYFVAVVEEGSLSAAARRCNLSQPALSQQMRVLEEFLGEELLLRHRRGVEPTAAGELLLRHARVLLMQVEKMGEEFAGRRELETGEVRFGVIPTVAPYVLPRLVGPFRRAHPGIVFSVEEARTSDLIGRTVAGEIEFAIVSDVMAAERKRWSLHVRELFREALYLALPASHRLALQSESPKPSELDADELIFLSDGHCLMERTLRLCRIRRSNPRLQCDQLATALALVSAGLGVAVVPELAIRDYGKRDVVFRAFSGEGLWRVISVMRRRGGRLSAAARGVLSCLKMEERKGGAGLEF